jgi:hypothetical protein
MAEDKDSKDPISDATTIDELLKSSGDRALKSMERHIELANQAMKRLVDPKSVKTSVADDAQQVLGIVARDAMTAFDVWSRLLALAGEKKEATDG